MASPSKDQSPARLGVPYGLFAALGVYALLVVGYIYSTYWSAPAYQAAQHYADALVLLGVNDGRTCSQAQLLAAMNHVLEAARLVPQEKALAEHVERLRWRFDERHFKLPPELAQRAEMVSAAARRAEQAKDPWLVVGVHDRGWAAEQLLAGPQRVMWWSIPGGVLIVLLWAYGRFSARAVRAKEHEADLRRSEDEVKALGAHRDGLPSPPQAASAPRKKRPPSGARPAVKRRPPPSE